jgi:hypothetical protein
VRKKKDGAVLGVVTEHRWFDAREEACHRYGVDRGDIEVTLLPDEPIESTANGTQKEEEVKT